MEDDRGPGDYGSRIHALKLPPEPPVDQDQPRSIPDAYPKKVRDNPDHAKDRPTAAQLQVSVIMAQPGRRGGTTLW